MAPGLAGVSQLTAQRLLMGFWHASDDIVAGVRQVPRDLPSPYTRPKIIRVWCSRPFPLIPHGSLSNKCPSRGVFGRDGTV
jgi:hypothetical protein